MLSEVGDFLLKSIPDVFCTRVLRLSSPTGACTDVMLLMFRLIGCAMCCVLCAVRCAVCCVVVWSLLISSHTARVQQCWNQLSRSSSAI